MNQIRQVSVPTALLGAALLASSVLVLHVGAGLTFFQDTWTFLLYRQELALDAIFVPHNEHIVAAPVLIEMALIHAFGMESALPERLVLVALLAVAAILLFIYLRPRVGAWPALFASVLLLFCGPAWQVMLWPFQYSLVGAMACGLATLIALDRGTTRWDLVACASLILCFSFGSVGIAFALAAGVDVWLRRRERGMGRIYVALVPPLLPSRQQSSSLPFELAARAFRRTLGPVSSPQVCTG